MDKNEQIETSKVEENSSVQFQQKKSLDLGIDELNNMMLQNALKLPLDKIDFNNMPVDNILFILENNKNGGNIIDNSTFDYVIVSAKQNITLAKILVEKYRLELKDNLFIILDSILKLEPNYIIDTTSLDIVEVIQSYLKVGNFEFIKEFISQISPNKLLTPYRYDNNKTILEVILENKAMDFFDEEQLEFIVKDKNAAIVLLKNEWFSNNLIELLESNDNDRYTTMLLNTLIQIESSTIFLDFVSKNFDRIGSNSSLLNGTSLNNDLLAVFLRHGIFLPIVSQEWLICWTFKSLDGLTVLDYALSRYENGQKMDLSIDFFDRKMIEVLNSKDNDYFNYVTTYCKHKRFEPFLKVNIDSLLLYYNNGQNVLEYIISNNPNFIIEPRNDPDFTLSLIRSYIKYGNWEAISPHVKYFKNYIFNPYSDKLYFDIFVENNVKFDEEVIEFFKDYVGKASKNPLLLEKDKNGITILEKLLQIDREIGRPLVKASFDGQKVDLQVAVILGKYGFRSNPECEDKYSKEFQQYINELVRKRDIDKYKFFEIDDQELKREGQTIVEEFLQCFRDNSDEKLISIVLEQFWKYLAINKEVAFNYLTNLINLKKKDPNFSLLYDINKRSYYKEHVNLNTYDHHVLEHEIGHAIHKINANYEYPDHIKILIENLKSDPETLVRLQAYAMHVETSIELRRKELYKEFLSFIEQIPDYFYKIREEYNSMLENSNNFLAQTFTRSGNSLYSDAVFEKIINKEAISYDDYMLMTSMNDRNEYVSRTIKYEFASALMLENLMDAIYDGRWNEGKLDGVNIECYSGHSIEYFKKNSIFEEIFANISGLMFDIIDKQDDIEGKLRYLIGDELCDALLEYYNQLNQDQNKTK